jgi:hypothetical protein
LRVLKPGSSKVSVYVPGGIAGKRYIPSALVTTDCTPIMLGLVALTVTPGSTALLVSVTLPVIVPVELAPPPCANAGAVASRHAASTANRTGNLRPLMNILPLSKEQQTVRDGDSANADVNTDLKSPVAEQRDKSNVVLDFRGRRA